MSTPEGGPARPADRLAELGLVLPVPPAPVAAYTAWVRSGPLVFTSGQLPFVDGELPVTGVVGRDADAGEVDPAQARELAARAALNGLAVLAAALDETADPTPDSLSRALGRVRVIKVVGFVASAPGFTAQPAVVDGASTLLADVLGERGVHARSAVGVAALPLGAPVEVELIAEVVEDVDR